MLPDFDRESLRRLLADAIKLMCKSSLKYQTEFTVEGLLGITLDKTDVFLINIAESIHSNENDVHNILPVNEVHEVMDDQLHELTIPQATSLKELPGNFARVSPLKRKVHDNIHSNQPDSKRIRPYIPITSSIDQSSVEIFDTSDENKIPSDDIKLEPGDYDDSNDDHVVKVELDEDGDLHG